MLGNASKIDAAKIQVELSRILAPGEKVEPAYKSIMHFSFALGISGTAAPIHKQFNKNFSI